MADENIFAIGATMAGHYGAAATGVTLAETTFEGAWNVQGDAGQSDFVEAVRETFALAVPVAPNTTTRDGALTALWLSPTSWLVVASDEPTIADFEARRDAVNAAGGALFDIGASRVAWTITGPHAATVLAKRCPLDFHPNVFVDGACAQSVFGHVNALFCRRAASSVFTMMVARSLARDAWRSLCESAAQYGYDILRPRTF